MPSALVALLLAFASCCALAQQYPARPIRLVVPLAPGGGADTTGRYIGRQLTDGLGQQVIIENRAGGGGLIGGEFVARAAPDGYTLIVGGSGQLVVTLTHRKIDLQKDFTPIAGMLEYPSLLVVHPSLPVRNVAELIRLAKARPGQINYASAGTGSAGHLVMEMFRTMAGVDMVHVPYKGAGAALTDVVGGQVSILFSNPVGTISHVKAGRVRALATSGSKRMTSMPGIPTVAESGLPGFSSTFFLGILGPAGVPRDVVAKLNAEMAKVLQRPDVQEWITQQGAEPLPGSPEDLAAKIRADFDKLVKLVRDTGMKLN